MRKWNQTVPEVRALTPRPSRAAVIHYTVRGGYPSPYSFCGRLVWPPHSDEKAHVTRDLEKATCRVCLRAAERDGIRRLGGA